MFVGNLTQTRTKLSYLFAIILLCVGYFNSLLISESIVIFFQISSLIGQLLVNKSLTIFKCTVEIVKLTYSFFQILYEDSLIFLKDATEKFAFAISLLKELYLFLEECAWNLIKTVFVVTETVLHFFEFIHRTLGLVKEGIHLTGLTIWIFFANIPGIVVSNIVGMNEFLTNTINEIYIFTFKIKDDIIESAEKIFFLFDVPLDSVNGLIIGAVFLTVICALFKNICHFISRVFLKLYFIIISFGISLWNGSFLEQKSRRHVYAHEDNERFCIICQNQLKEVLIFPCKHLCLCGDCSLKLIKNQPLCPICRTDITGTLKVYM